MGSHSEHHNHSTENKPVSFIVPLIFGLVVTLTILLLVSLGDPKHGSSEHGGHGKQGNESSEKENAHHGDAQRQTDGEEKALEHETSKDGHH
jgi:hypothetical protein